MEQGGIELSAAHVGLTQAGALQHCVGHQCELHLGLGEAGVFETGRNEVRPTLCRQPSRAALANSRSGDAALYRRTVIWLL